VLTAGVFCVKLYPKREFKIMTREFVNAEIFDKRWYELGLTDDDLYVFQSVLLENPAAGDIIAGTGGLRKVRWSLPNTGKSGGIRALYADFIRQDKIYLVNCYSKKEQDNITDKEKAMYKTLIKSIKRELEEDIS